MNFKAGDKVWVYNMFDESIKYFGVITGKKYYNNDKCLYVKVNNIEELWFAEYISKLYSKSKPSWF